ncbi:hypothetical protein F52700_1167 [Fusarium sp. NRRL 52700]|nr:hypothetical protein F52700_1167 [Fusarium sp. NRRL 52700]
MKFSHLLPFFGLAQAVPAPNPSYPSIFDNPTIPVGAPASFKDLPARRAAAATQQTFLNMTWCDVTVTGDVGFYTSWKAQITKGNLYITEAIPSPGTKNGANPYEVYLQSASLAVGGGIQFITNKKLLGLPYKLGTSSVDYARVYIASDGYIVSKVDYANLDNPVADSPLLYTTEFSISGSKNYGPPTRNLAYAPSFLSVNVGDKGILTGGVQLQSSPDGLGAIGYVARIAGTCRNFRVPV